MIGYSSSDQTQQGEKKKKTVSGIYFFSLFFYPQSQTCSFYTLYFLFFVLPEGPVVKNVSLLMPEMFVAGSARASVSVLGERLAGNASILLKRSCRDLLPSRLSDPAKTVSRVNCPLRWHHGPRHEEHRQAPGHAVWLRRAEHDSVCAQHLHPQLPEEHGSADPGDPGQSHALPEERWVWSIHCWSWRCWVVKQTVVETIFWTPLVFNKMTSHSTHPDYQSPKTTGVQFSYFVLFNVNNHQNNFPFVCVPLRQEKGLKRTKTFCFMTITELGSKFVKKNCFPPLV